MNPDDMNSIAGCAVDFDSTGFIVMLVFMAAFLIVVISSYLAWRSQKD